MWHFAYFPGTHKSSVAGLPVRLPPLMRLSCSHPVLLHRLAELKASAMICNGLYDILINPFPAALEDQRGFPASDEGSL